ncbi:MAG: PAS domain S-box protein [Candidatus Kapabacteria bacterium]|nr:PAS domain S-box protein [Candidatus Kapabacteria bacterium]
MRLFVAVLLLIIGTLELRADAGEPLRYVVGGTWQGRRVDSPSDTSRRLIIYPRPAWDASSSTLAVFDAKQRTFVECAQTLNVLDAAFFHVGILVVHRRDADILLRLLTADGTKTIVDDVRLSRVQGTAGHVAVRMEVSENGTRALVLVGDALYAVTGTAEDASYDMIHAVRISFTSQLIEQGVFAAGFVSSHRGQGVVFAYRLGPVAFLARTDSTMRIVSSHMVPMAEVSRMEQVGSSVILYSSLAEASGCVLTVLDLDNESVLTRSLTVDESRVTAFQRDGARMLAVLTTRSGRPEIVCMPLALSLERMPAGTVIPGDYGSPRMLRAFGDTIVAIFSGGIALVRSTGEILARNTLSTAVPERAELRGADNELLIRSPSFSISLQKINQPLWFVSRSWDALLRTVIPALFVISLGALFFVYRRQRRFLEAIIDTPGAGIVVFIDVNGRLVRVNDRAASLLRITTDVPMGRMFESYMSQPGLEQLRQFIDRVRHSRESHTDRITMSRADETKEYMISSTPILGTLGSSRGMLFSGIDITETLEQRRLVNWAQLAHDMQTNLSTIRLNAEQFRGVDGTGDDERRRRILFQVGVLIDRVRDLLGVARSDVFQRTTVHSAELCTEVRHEFDPAMFPHVTFSMKLRGTLMQADRMKLSRAVRNAVENAIKALRNQPGTVEISTWFDRSNVFISVSDTGVGMDPETMANMMKPYFSTSNDGSGHGIGTMIMHHVTKLHGGTIRVTSEPGRGTQVVFRIPHGMEPKDKIRSLAAEQVS